MLQAILIENKTERANSEKANLAKAIIFLNALNALVKAAGLTPSIADLQLIVTKLLNTLSGSQWLRKFVIDALVAKAGEQSFGGVKLSSAKVREMVEVPHLGAIEDYVMDNAFFLSNYAFEPELMELVGGAMQATAAAQSTIENRNKVYTKNDRGVEVYNRLNEIANLLNGFTAYAADSLGSDKIDTVDLTTYGLIKADSAFKPSLRFIRNQEACYPNYVAQ